MAPCHTGNKFSRNIFRLCNIHLFRVQNGKKHHWKILNRWKKDLIRRFYCVFERFCFWKQMQEIFWLGCFLSFILSLLICSCVWELLSCKHWLISITWLKLNFGIQVVYINMHGILAIFIFQGYFLLYVINACSLVLFVSENVCLTIQICGSRKYPYPHLGGNWKFQRGGVVNGQGNNRGEEGWMVG